VLVPYSKYQLVSCPFGVTVPLSFAEVSPIELAASVWSRLKKGATLNDLQKDLPRSTYAIYRTVATLLESGQIQ
jgi:hypothetical protein